MTTNFIDRKSLPWKLFQTPETHQSSESLKPQDPGKPLKPPISSSTPITPRRSPRLAQIKETSPHILQVKRKRSKEGKTPRAKRRLITDGRQGETTFGSIINRLETHLTYITRTQENKTFLEITRKEVDIKDEHGGPLPGARVVVSHEGLAYFQPDGGSKEVLEENVFQDPEALDRLLCKLGSRWHYCCGIAKHIYDEHTGNIRYTPKDYVEEASPCHVVRTGKCKRWFYARTAKKNLITNQVSCPECNLFFRCKRRSNSRNDIPSSKKMSRLDVSSTFLHKFLSPSSKKVKQRKNKQHRKITKQKVARLRVQVEKNKFILEQEQNQEMIDIVSTINEKYKGQLENIWKEAEQEKGQETQALLKEIWEKDTLDRTAFYHDQAKNITGRKSNKWSTITYRIALAVHSRSPAAYEALKSFKILQLPSTSSLKSFKGARLHQPGINAGIGMYVKEQPQNYIKYKDEVTRRGQNVPLHEGILIFDEVKVNSKVKWSSSGQKFFGLALTDKEFGLLYDVY